MYRRDIFPAEATVLPFQEKAASLKPEREWNGKAAKKSGLSPWVILKLTFMYVYSIHIVSNAIAGSIRTSSLSYIIETLTYTVRSLVSTVTTTYFVVKASELSGITDELAQFEGVQPTKLLERAASKRRYLRFSIVCYSCLLIAMTVLFFVLVPAQKYFDKCFYGIDLARAGIPNGPAILIGLIEWDSYNVLVTGSPVLMTNYIYLCDYLRAQMLGFRASVRAVLDSGPLNVTKFEKVRTMCTRLIDVERRLDSLFAPAVLLWFVDLLVNIVLPIRTLINGIASFTLANVMSFFIEVIYSVSFFMILSFSLAQVDKEYKEIEEETFRLRTSVATEDWQLCQQVTLLESNINSSKFTLTGWGLFEVDRSFILTIVGAVATYTVVLIQLTPGQDTY
ncbi:high-energy light unresponsive protein 1-like isoform X2 [Dermacentor albipictus]